MYNKAFKYIPSIEVFNTLKVSVDDTDTLYTIGSAPQTFGTPEILWENICFIELEKLIWTHGAFYCTDDYVRFTDAEILAMMPED